MSLLLHAGLDVTVPLLVTVYIEHPPGRPVASACPSSGHVYVADEIDCPTNKVVRPVLVKRRHEHETSLDRLTPEQFEDLTTPAATSRVRRSSAHPEPPAGLFA